MTKPELLAAAEAFDEPLAWAQLGMLNGRTYLREPYSNTPYPPPPDVVRNLNLKPLYLHPSPREARLEALLREAQQLCHLGDGDTDLHARIRAELGEKP